MPDRGPFGQQRLYFVDPMEPAPLFNNPREVNTQVINLDDFRVPDFHYSPAINAGWDIPGVPEAEENDDQVCPSILAPEAVRDAQTAFTLPAHDEAVRLPPREEVINAQQFDTIPQPVDARWLSLRRQQGRHFAQRDALGINVGGNFVDNPVDNEYPQHFMESSEIEVLPKEQRRTTPPPGLATTTANSDGGDVRQQKQNTVKATKRTHQKKKTCAGRFVLGLWKTVKARLKKKASTARLPASQRGSHTLPESGRRQAMVALHDTLHELVQPEDSEISAKTDKASVVLEATDRIVSLEGRVEEILEELKTARQSRNILPAMPTAYFSASVRLHVSGLGEMWVTIHSLQQARELHRLFVRLVSSVINVSRQYGPEMVHLDISTVVFGASYTIHTEPNAGSDSAVDELHTTLQMVVHCEIFRTQ